MNHDEERADGAGFQHQTDRASRHWLDPLGKFIPGSPVKRQPSLSARNDRRMEDKRIQPCRPSRDKPGVQHLSNRGIPQNATKITKTPNLSFLQITFVSFDAERQSAGAAAVSVC
jgi:hypothetical protein